MRPRLIDPTTWARRDVYAWFRQLELPYASITAEVDATRLVTRAKAAGVSLFAALLQQLAFAANAVPELRQRIRVKEGVDVVVEHAVVAPAFTVAVAGGLFNYASVPLQRDLAAFASSVAVASEALAADPVLAPLDAQRDDVLFMSCLPWVRFTSLTHPMPLGRVDSVPRLAWGRLTDVGGAWRCPVNVQVHHALVDGQHLGRFYEALQGLLDGFEGA